MASDLTNISIGLRAAQVLTELVEPAEVHA